MKFQKTLLAASLAVLTVSAYAQDAKPVSVTENLVNNNPIYVNGFVSAPVHGFHATNSIAIDTDQTWLPTITNNGKVINLGTGLVNAGVQQGANVIYDVFKYTGENNQAVYQFSEVADPTKKSGVFVKNATGDLVEYKGTYDVKTLEKGGQIAGQAGALITSGFENRQVNGERVVYGYQGGSRNEAGRIDGTVVAPDGSPTEERLRGSLGAASNPTNEVRYVQQGIIANTNTSAANGGPAFDPSKNIYGVSARDNNNVVMMTGNGIALADLSLKGKLQTDGSVANSVLVKSNASGTQKTREYAVDGKRILEVYNDDAGRVLEPKFYEITANGTDLAIYSGTKPVIGTHIKSGTAVFNDGNFEISKVQNTVTNKNVTYKESVSTQDQTQVKAGITNPNAATTDIDKTFAPTAAQIKTEQAVSTGVIGANEDKSNKYGLEVTKTTADAEGKLVTTKSSITAAGISTTGFIDAADYRIAGKSISASLTDAVKNAQDAAGTVKVEAVQEAKTYTDTKSTETLAAANTAAQAGDAAVLAESKSYTNNMIEKSGVSRMSKRLDNVEETANRGVAIALAANQPMPNIKPGQVAVFGGVGHYEGESAVALGAGTMLADGRTSISGAFGFAGSEIGGRVGLSYTFGQ